MSHPTHKTRSSDSSLYMEVCTLCGANDGRGTKTRLDKPCPRAEEVAAYNRTDWPGSESFNPPGLSKAALGARTGRFDSSKPNQGNTPQSDTGNRLLNKILPTPPKAATEIVPGKKYLLVIKPGRITQEAHEQLCNSAPVFEEYFKARGIDMTFLVSEFDTTELYELEPAPKQLNADGDTRTDEEIQAAIDKRSGEHYDRVSGK
jgi:hypothetical protein